MKRCPECRRDYYDDRLLYCLDDGTALLEGPAGGSSTTEPRTEIIQKAALANAPTRVYTSGKRNHAEPADLARPALAAQAATKPLLLFGIAAVIIVGAYFGYRNFALQNTGRINSIAVMPFENRSGSADSDYLSDGLTDSLIFRFSQLPSIKVSPTSSVMRYKGTQKDVGEIARDLDVDAVFTGRLTQLGDNLNISVQLIDGRANKLLWAEQYDRKMADLLATQREIAIAITDKMQLKLSGDERGITKKYTNSNEAYQLYLKGRFHWAKRKKEDMLIAVASFKQAIELDPNFALAYVGIAEAYNSMGKNPDIPPRDAIPLAKQAAVRALELDPMLAEAHSALADSMAIGDWDWTGSEKEFRKAFELDPNIAYIHVAFSGSYLTAAGRIDEAVAETARAIELEPVSLVGNALHVASLMNARRYEEALVQARRAYDLDHDFPLARHWLGLALSANGKYDEAIALCKELPQNSPFLPIGLFIEGYAHARAGHRAEAEQILAQMKEAAKEHYIRPYYIACIWAALGDKDKAIAELQRSFAEKDCYLPRIKVDPFMDPLRDDRRFKDLLRAMNLAV